MNDRKKNEEMIAKLNQLFSYLGVDHEQNINRIIQYTWIILNGACSLYNRVDNENTTLVTRYGYHLPKNFKRILPAEGCICYEETIRNKSGYTIIEDLSKTSYSDSDPNVRELRFKSYLGFPVILDGEPKGSLCILDKEIRRFTSTEINLIAILAKAISIEEKQQQVQKELRDSEERLKILFEYAPDAYYLSDLNGILLDGNKAAEELIRVNRHDLIGKNYFDLNLLSADQLPKAALLLERNIKGEPTGPDEFILNRSDGSTVQVEIRTFPVKIKGQNIALGITRDITERLRAEEAMRFSEKRLSQIVEGNSIATFVLDQNHIITHWNRACENMTGFPASKMIGTNDQWRPFYQGPRPVMADLLLDAVSDDEFLKYYGETFRRSRLVENGCEAEIFIQTLVHKGRWLFLTAAPLIDSDGKITGAMETLQDLTDRKQAEEALMRARKELEEKVKERTINLEEANTALRVLLRAKDDNTRQIQEKTNFNVRELILPYLEKLKKGRLPKKESMFLDILEKNLSDITSSYSYPLSTQLLNLTPMEIQVANFVKQGKSTKEIAEILNLSERTIETHRKNIRTKIGIKSKKTNLRSYLLTIQ